MIITKKRLLLFVSLILILTFTSCSSNKTSKETETTPPPLSNKLPVILASDIVSEIGKEIDYRDNLKIVNATSDDYYNITISSSSVDNTTLGTYSAIYMVDYANGMITKQISVTIVDALDADEDLPTVVIEEVTTANNAQEETVSTPEATIPETTASQSNNSETTTTKTSTAATTTTTTSTSKQNTTSNNSIPNAVIQLSDGTTVEIENTATRYVYRTFSDESHSVKDGGKYLTSELKVEFNTGEIQVLESIVTRVE